VRRWPPSRERSPRQPHGKTAIVLGAGGQRPAPPHGASNATSSCAPHEADRPSQRPNAQPSRSTTARQSGVAVAVQDR